MPIGNVANIDLSKGFGVIMKPGGGNIRFQEADVADGFEFTVAGLRGKRVSYEERVRSHAQKRWEQHATNVKLVE